VNTAVQNKDTLMHVNPRLVDGPLHSKEPLWISWYLDSQDKGFRLKQWKYKTDYSFNPEFWAEYVKWTISLFMETKLVCLYPTQILQVCHPHTVLPVTSHRSLSLVHTSIAAVEMIFSYCRQKNGDCKL